MATTNTVVARAATSWGAVIGGWVATIGASVLFAPMVAGLLAAAGLPQSSSDLALAVPVVLGILLSYIVGGYVAGRMAGYRTSWHGMMTAFFTLFILLVVLLVGALADNGVFASSGINRLTDVLPGLRDLNVDSFGNALSFGAMLGFLAAIFGGWLGGLLAPSHSIYAMASPAPRPEPVVHNDRQVAEERPRRGLPIAVGRKGGERVEETRREERKVDEVHKEREGGGA